MNLLTRLFYNFTNSWSFVTSFVLGIGLIQSGGLLLSNSIGAFLLVAGVFGYLFIGQLLLMAAYLTCRKRKDWQHASIIFNIIFLWPLLSYLVFIKKGESQK